MWFKVVLLGPYSNMLGTSGRGVVIGNAASQGTVGQNTFYSTAGQCSDAANWSRSRCGTTVVALLD